MSEWNKAMLGDLLDIFDSVRVPLSAAQRVHRKGTYPYYGAQGIIDYIDGFLFDGRYLLIPEDGENLNSRKLPIAYFAEGKFWVNNHAHIVRGKPGVADDVFIKHALNAKDISGYVTGAAQPKLSQGNLKRMELLIPSYRTQRRIASILGAYDDLIEVNRRRVAVLEEMARSLFDEWFVRFRFPGHETVPMIDTPDGPLPQGWSRCKLSEVADLCLGKMLDKKKNKGSLRPYLANINVRWGSLDLQNLRELRFEDRELERYGLRSGDIVMCEGGEPGRCVLWRDQMPGMMIQKALHRIRPAERVESEYLYYALFHRGRSGGLEQYFTGATIKHLPGEQLAKVHVVVPGTSTQSRFSTVVRPMLQLTDKLIAQCADLAASRDLLLPRLISGQLSVERVERELELAA